MNIQDILRGLPFPMQGALMQIYGATANQQPAQIERVAGAGRGFVNPPLVDPNAPNPTMPPVRSAPAPAPMPGEQPLPPMAAAMAPVATPEPTEPPPVLQEASSGPAPGRENEPLVPMPSQGLLSTLGFQDGNQAMSAIGAALAVAGSQDPAKALNALQQTRLDEGKLLEAKRKANQPKVDHIPGTPFFQVTNPDGTTRMVNEPGLAKFYDSQSDSKAARKVAEMVLQSNLTQANQQASADNKTAADARPLLADIQGLKSRWTQAQEIISTQGTAAQLQGIPGISGIAGFFGGDEVAKNKFLEGLTVDETLLNTARSKGAISNQEMNLFKSPIPSVTDDREKVWKPWIEKRLEVLDKMEKFQASEVARGERGASAPAAGAPAPAASSAPAAAATPSAIQTQAAASFGAYEPNKYEYRMGPNGNLQRRLKGQ